MTQPMSRPRGTDSTEQREQVSRAPRSASTCAGVGSGRKVSRSSPGSRPTRAAARRFRASPSPTWATASRRSRVGTVRRRALLPRRRRSRDLARGEPPQPRPHLPPRRQDEASDRRARLRPRHRAHQPGDARFASQARSAPIADVLLPRARPPPQPHRRKAPAPSRRLRVAVCSTSAEVGSRAGRKRPDVAVAGRARRVYRDGG